jgi:hypothetical protein
MKEMLKIAKQNRVKEDEFNIQKVLKKIEVQEDTAIKADKCTPRVRQELPIKKGKALDK